MRLFKDNDLIQEGFVKSGIIAIIVCYKIKIKITHRKSIFILNDERKTITTTARQPGFI